MATKAKKPAAVKKVAAKKPAKKVKAGGNGISRTDKIKRFLEAFLSNNGNLRQAALAMGCGESAADKAGQRMSKNVLFLSMLKERQEEVSKRCELTTERTLREIARLAYSDPRRLYNPDGSLKLIHELDDDAAATIASVEVDVLREDGKAVGETVKVKQWDKNSALEKAMKFHGLYEKDNAQQQPVEIVIKF